MLSLAALVTAAAVVSSTQPRTLRLDYFHTGGATEEYFALDAIVLEGEWPGPLDRTIDDTNLGKYLFEVIDRATNRVAYSRGFASIFGEWETTGEARQRHGTFHESLRFPEPAGAFQVVLKKRDPGNAFIQIWSVLVDPADPFIDRTGQPTEHEVWAVTNNGEPRDKVDLVLLGDGYTAAEKQAWHQDARRLTEVLFATPPFKKRRQDFNVWAVDSPSWATGVARPSDAEYRRSALRVAYDAFGSERYALGLDNKRIREAAAAAPYEFVAIVLNEAKYGGGGIHNLYLTAAAHNAFTPYIFVHEFGHNFAGLADEYYTSAVAFESGAERPEPWEPNVTADPAAGKWRDLVVAGTSLPTAWPKQAFESAQREIQVRRRELRAEGRPEMEMEALFREERELMTELLSAGAAGDQVGAFEGAMYQSEGYFRSQQDCIMFTRDEVGFCAVCRRAIERVIDLYAKR